MTDDLDKLVRRFIDGELPAEQEPEALRRIAEDEEARALLRFEMQVRGAWNDPVDVPAGFADRTMEAIQAAETKSEAAAFSLRSIGEQIWTWLVEPRVVRLRPSVALATAVLLMATAVSLWPAPRSAEPEPMATSESATTAPTTTVAQKEVVWTRFMYANNEASSVAVAGDFSGWEPIPLSAKTVDGQTVWTGMVPVTKGEHQYMFVIDGSKWVTDPLAPIQRADGFGNKNAVLQL